MTPLPPTPPPPTPPPPSLRDDLARRVRGVLTPHPNVREVRMFGGLSFLVDELMAVAAGREGNLLVRVDPAAYDDLLRRGGEPAHMGEDRPMGRGWLTVPHDRLRSDDDLASWVGIGIDSRHASTRAASGTAGPGRPTGRNDPQGGGGSVAVS